MDTLTIWTIFDRPRDHPAHIVIRGFDARPDGSVTPRRDVMRVASIPEARAILRQNGLSCLGRQPEDDPSIVESWI